MRLMHLALDVKDQERSLRFYGRYFGFDAAGGRRYPDGTVIVSDDNGFDLGLRPGTVRTGPEDFFHFGFAMDSAAEVRDLLKLMVDAGLTIVEQDDEPHFQAFKVLDPDGYKIQVYWEER